MEQDTQLANFAEWNPNPILKLNISGSVIYANLMARTQFPDIMTQGLSHPILKGLESIIRDFQPNQQSEVIVYDREIELDKREYDQQIFGLPNEDIYVYVIDVTERKQLKAQAHFNDKLAVIGTVAASVAHEIVNPITWMLGNLNLLKDFTSSLKVMMSDFTGRNHTAPDIQELMNKVDEIISELLQGMEQIRDITYSLKGVAHIDKNEIVSVNLHKILNMAITIASLEFKDRASLERNFTENMPVIMSTPGKLHQVFLNLLINAAQSFAKNDIEHNKISVSTYFENDRIKINISDNGQGIPPNILQKIFEPFFTTKASGQGSGLGLAVCKEIIHDLKGEISVESTVGQGTVFSVYLPVSPVALKKPTESDVRVVSKKHILLVDNEPILLKLMQRVLEKQNQVTTALGGTSAMELISQNGKQFDAIITDLNMPGTSGSDLYRYAAEKYPGLEKRFIFITGGVEMPWVKEFLKTTDNPVLEKPFLPAEIIQLVDKM